MAEMSDLSRWEKELSLFNEVLANPRGQAIVIVGPAGSGKSTLMTMMVAYAKKHEKFICEGCNIYGVRPNDIPNKLLQDIVIKPGEIAAYLEESFNERLSDSVKEFGDLSRRVIGIDAYPKMPVEFERMWMKYIPELPDKVKFIFTQRPDSILATNKEFMSLSNVVRIDIEAPPKSDERKEVREQKDSPKEGTLKEDKNKTSEGIEVKLEELKQDFRKFMLLEKEYPKEWIEGLQIQTPPPSIKALSVIRQNSDEMITTIGFCIDDDPEERSVISSRIQNYKQFVNNKHGYKQSIDIGFIVTPEISDSNHPFSIYEVDDGGDPKLIDIEQFLTLEDLIKKVDPETKAYGSENSDDQSLINTFRESFISFLINEKKFPRENLKEGVLANPPLMDLTVNYPDSNDILAIFNFSKPENDGISSREPSDILAKVHKVGSVGKYNPFVYTVYPSRQSNEDFWISELEDDSTSSEILSGDFPTYNQLLFASPLSNKGRRINSKLIKLAKDKHGFSVQSPCEDYFNLQIKKNGRTAAQIHRVNDSDDNIAFALAGYQEEFPDTQSPSYLSRGEVEQLSGYTSKSQSERNWLKGNIGHQELKYEAGVYILKPGSLVLDEVENEVGELLDLAKSNAENKGPAEPEEGDDRGKLKGSVSEHIGVGDDATLEIIGESKSGGMSVAEHGWGDRIAVKDKLGFRPYVEVVARFLTHEETELPLTLSVEGEWGSGKSSFLSQLKSEIRKIYKEKGQDKTFIVEFDPWRHDKDEALWAAFALKFIKDVSKCLTKRERWRANYELWRQRFPWKQAWPDVLRIVFVGLAWILATIGICIGLWNGIKLGATGTLVFPERIGSIIAFVVSLWAVLGKVKDFLGSPLAVDLKKYMRHPDYVSKVSFIEKFHDDFKKIVSAYVGEERVYVFVDDLDRCEVPKAAELMESINLMISENPKLAFVMGMDREKVAAGLAVKHEKLLPYLAESTVMCLSEEEAKRRRGVRYGYSFIEKFIQVPFGLPQPDEKSINEMLMGMSGQMKEDKKEQVKKTKTKRIETGTEAEEQALSEPIGEVPKTKTAKIKKEKKEEDKKLEEKKRDIRKEQIEEEFLKFDGDDPTFRAIVLMVSKAFDFNPRRAKQFVNIFRLRAATAKLTGLYEQKDGKRITFEQLGKFVGIGLGWPLLIRDIERRPALLEELVDAAEGRTEGEAKENNNPPKKSVNFEKWADDDKLIELLKAGCENQKDMEKRRRFSLKGLSVSKLLQVAPSVMSAEEEQV